MNSSQSKNSAAPAKKPPTRKELVIFIGRMQSVIGNAINRAQNDRAPDRMDKLIPPLEEAFNRCVEIRSDFPADW